MPSTVPRFVRPAAAALLALGAVSACTDSLQPRTADHRNATYTIEGRPVTLVDGLAEEPSAPGAATRMVTRYIGNEARSDLNADGRADVVFLLTQERGDSGTFYYVVAALDTEAGFVGSHGVLLGDRIAPQATEIRPDGIVVVSYADRAAGESFATPPSVGKSIWLKLDPDTRQFGQVAQNFEGEADPARMTLDMQTWTWVRALYNDGREIVPRRAGAFTLTFRADGTVAVTTDCNAMSGTYTTNGRELTFGDMAATRMFCADSQETELAQLLANVSSYLFTARGELVLELRFDSGSVIFR